MLLTQSSQILSLLLSIPFPFSSEPQTRKPRSIFINVRGRELEYEILNICEFNSTRKRMSAVVRAPDGKIKLYCKGADTVIMSLLTSDQPFTEQTLIHLEDYATDGLRTLCVAMREVPEQEYRQWSQLYDNAASQINGRAEALDKAAEIIEQNMFLLGATAIEDKLQEGVPETIHTLQQAGIKVWVLTGDRQETAINIGLSARLISESMNLVSETRGEIISRSSPSRLSLSPLSVLLPGHNQRGNSSRHERISDQETGSHQVSTKRRRTRRVSSDY